MTKKRVAAVPEKVPANVTVLKEFGANVNHRAAHGGVDAEQLKELGIEFSGNIDKINWDNPEDRELPDPDKILRPAFWKLLIMPMRPKPVSKGGLILPQIVQDADQYLNYVGRLVSVGPLAFRHQKFAQMGLQEQDIPKRGDWLVYNIYQYQRIDFKGLKLILLNDDSFLATVPPGVSPWDFKLDR